MTSLKGPGMVEECTKAQPFVFNLGVAAAKTSAADMMTQTEVEQKSFPNEIDWKRNASFTD